MHKQPKSAPELSYEKENPEIIFHYLNVVSGFPTNTKHLRITSITMSNINKIESCQRWFTKRIKCLSDMRYPERFASLGLETLQARPLKCDLQMCYKVIHNQISVFNGDFWCLPIVRILEDIVINCTRVIRRLTRTNISSQTVFVISGIHYRGQ